MIRNIFRPKHTLLSVAIEIQDGLNDGTIYLNTNTRNLNLESISMKSIFSPNKTSAALLLDFANEKWSGDAKDQLRYLIVYDLYIKARSYGIINKTAFVFTLFTSVFVAFWPLIDLILRDFGFQNVSAIFQTSVTAFAALSFSIYSHYKKRQLHTENLMRSAIYNNEPINVLTDKVLWEMGRIDSGFIFYQSTSKEGTREDNTGDKG